MAADGFSGMGGGMDPSVGCECFPDGVYGSARSALDEAVSFMILFHGHENALSVERRVRTLALKEVDPVVPQVNRVLEER